jgi:YtcA-like protein
MAHGLPRARRLAAVAPVVLTTACDPIVNIYGSFFPAWVLCLLTGVASAAGLRFVFAVTGLEEGFAPLLLVYPALAFLVACATWLALFRG